MDRRPAAAHPVRPSASAGLSRAGDGSEHPEAGAPSVPSYWRQAEGPPGRGAGHPRQGLALCPRPRDERPQPQQPSPHFPCPLLSCPRGGEEEAPPWARRVSQVTITTKHLKCQHLWWVAFPHNWRQSGNTTGAPCKRK